MKLSKSLKDIVGTGITQVVVVISSILILNMMSRLLSQEYFGLFMVIRRWVPVLIPVLTMNLGIGLTRYVGYDPENTYSYLWIAGKTMLLFSIGFAGIFYVFRNPLSSFFFNDIRFADVVPILMLFFVGNWVHLFVYAFYRGRLEMGRANGLKILFISFPILLLGGMTVFPLRDDSNILSVYFIAFSVWAIVSALYWVRLDVRSTFRKLKSGKLKTRSKQLFVYSIARVPAVFFDSLVYSLPVFLANFKVSLIEAGYMGIVVVSIRFFEILSMPFNIIFLPKFSQLKKQEDLNNIKNYSASVVDFIFTFLPVFVVTIPGLTRPLLLLWFGPDYAVVAKSLSLAVLFSMFYVGFVLLRGILDGLYVFPFSSVIGLIGVGIIFVLSLIMGDDLYRLTVAFSVGLAAHGVLALIVVLWKLRIPVQLSRIAGTVGTALVLFFFLRFLDGIIFRSSMTGIVVLLPMLAYRSVFFLLLYFAYWRNLPWAREVRARIQLGVGKEERRP